MKQPVLKPHAHTDALARFSEKLKKLPAPGRGAGYHPALLGAAKKGVWAGLADEAIFSAIRAHTDDRARRVPDSEIFQAISRARQDSGQFKTSNTEGRAFFNPPKQPVPKLHLPFPPLVFRQRLIETGQGYTETDFLNRSSSQATDYGGDDALRLLNTLYSDDDFLFIGPRERKDDCLICRVAEWEERLTDEAFKAIGFMNALPQIIPNPLTGEEHETKSGILSKRCDAAVKEYRFAVAEFDNLRRVDQLAFWATVPLPIAALIDSGGKSIHAWIKLSDIHTPEEWQITIKETLYGQMLVPMGCDPACSNPARLSRFAGHCREGTERVQKLLYVNQNPSPNGIFKE